MASILQVTNETEASASRVTKEGKKLTYKLSVIQQPERARACGSGAKSSADRRPVDPPPVIELRIFEGDSMNDVTVSHNANFFLFVTLESARPIAHGRVPQQTPNSPVLTGMFVSGMAYLDRPRPAGYFLFPDLSVRHEGRYRLSFNLYEEVKDPKDMDQVPHPNHPDHPNNRHQNARLPPHWNTPKAHVDWRLEVRSKPFTVYSAKKFPGLAESTALSRTVAEQGCRVRIRRDVRMRRRDTKPASNEYDEYDEEYVRRSPVGESAGPTANTHSDRYNDHRPYYPSYSTPSSANTSGQFPSSANSSQFPASATSSQFPPYRQPQPNYNQPTQPQQPPPPQQQQQQPQAYTRPPPATYPQTSPVTYQPAQYPQQQPHLAYPPPMPNQAPRQTSPTTRRPSIDHSTVSDYRHTSAYPHSLMSASQGPLYAYSENGYGRPASSLPYMGSHAGLPRLKMPLPHESKQGDAYTLAGPPPQSAPGPGVPAPAGAGAGAHRPSKRSYDAVFSPSTAPDHTPFRNGMRPPETDHTVDSIHPRIELDDDQLMNAGGGVGGMGGGMGGEGFSIQALKMQYKRADGTEISRRLPSAA